MNENDGGGVMRQVEDFIKCDRCEGRCTISVRQPIGVTVICDSCKASTTGLDPGVANISLRNILLGKAIKLSEEHAEQKLKMWLDDEHPTFDIFQVRMYREDSFIQGYKAAMKMIEWWVWKDGYGWNWSPDIFGNKK